MLRIAGLAGAALVAAVIATPAAAQDYFRGPYVGLMGGTGWGTADYTFNGIGYFNTADGDTFSHDVAGRPIGGVLGYGWQDGNAYYGFEYSIYSAILGISAYNVPNPFVGGDYFDLKGHWFTTLTPRIGVALGRVLVYGQAGPALGHLVAEVTDPPGNDHIWTPGPAFGLVAGGGIEIAATRYLSFGVGYQYLMLGNFAAGGQLTTAGGTPLPSYSDHDIQYSSHTIMGRVVWRMNPADDTTPISRGPILDWEGIYGGFFGGALHQAGGALGYNFAVGNRVIAGIEVQGGVHFCCSLAFEGDLTGRLGVLFADNVLAYAEGGVGYTNGSFYGVLGPGWLYTAGGGIEVAMSPRLSAFMEIKAVGGPGQGFIDTNFQSGINVHLK